MGKRRASGDGTLFKRADGLWVGGVELPPAPDGSRRVKRVTGKDRNAVLEKLRKLRAEVEMGRIPATSSVTLERWLDYWYSDILSHRRITQDTMKSYETVIRLHLKPRLGSKRLDRIQPADIRSLYTALEKKISGRTAQKADQALRLAFKAAVREGIISVNVMDRVDKPVYESGEQPAFDAATSVHVIGTAIKTQGQVWGARWALGFTTGARESEILGLEWNRVDLEAGTIDISWQLKRLQKAHGCGDPVAGEYPCGMRRSSFCPQARWDLPGWMQWRECVGTLVWTRPKTSAGTRIIPLVPGMVDVLAGIKNAGDNPHGLVFHYPDGRPFSQDQDQKMWKKLLVAAEVPHVSQHTVRHSTATLLLEAGVDVHVIQQVIGHAQVLMTRQYQHVSLELARAAWANLSAIMPPN